jgi:murein DD-endopeptidase MepM/ murein hydrolase activator NlpD
MILPIANAVLPTTGVRSFRDQRSATHVHQGIDLPAREGTPVRAPDDGIVRFATHAWRQGFTGYGRVVVLQHEPRVWTLYAHLHDVLVQPGQFVGAGEQIGTVGRTQFSAPDHTSMFAESGAHLHFEVSPKPYPQDSEAERLDPVAWLRSSGSSGGSSGPGSPAPIPEVLLLVAVAAIAFGVLHV